VHVFETKKKKLRRKRRYAKPSKATRKKSISRVIETMIENSSEYDRLDIIKHLVECGLSELGKHLSIDMSGAIILSTDDPGNVLQHAIIAHHQKTGVPLEDLYDRLLQSLAAPAALVN
jgi:hypothetical protein